MKMLKALAVITLVVPVMALAAQPSIEVVPSLTVSYSAVDLATDKDVQALYERIAVAARQVCPKYDSRDLEAFAVSRNCQHSAIARAIQQIGNARLAAVSRLTGPKTKS